MKCRRATQPNLNTEQRKTKVTLQRELRWHGSDPMSASNEILASGAVCTPQTDVVTTLSRSIRAFVVLAKPEITLMVMISAGVASVLASDSLRIVVLLKAVFGTGLLAAGASVLNQYFERDLDRKMRRTARRPLPAGELLPTQALTFGVALSASGMFYVLFVLNALTALLGLLTLISYLFIYTPLKTKTRLSTFLGAFPGAAPVLMGWSATTNRMNERFLRSQF